MVCRDGDGELLTGDGQRGVGVVDDDRAEDDGVRVAVQTEDGAAVDDLVERGDEDRLAGSERLVARIRGDRNTQPDGLVDHLLHEVGVRNQVGDRTDSLIQARLADQEAHDCLAAAGVLLDHQVAVLVAPLVPGLEHLILLDTQTRPRLLRQAGEDVAGLGQDVGLGGLDAVEIERHVRLRVAGKRVPDPTWSGAEVQVVLASLTFARGLHPTPRSGGAVRSRRAQTRHSGL